MKSLQNLSYKTLFTILFLALAGIVFLLKISGKTQKVSAFWWDDSWHYRQAINISSHNSLESNVYITTSVNIGTTAKAQIDDGDFRFISQSGENLSYYIVSGAGTTNVSFHILIPSFPSGTSTIYAYYGNTTADNGFSGSDFSTEASNYTIGSLSSEEAGGGPIAYWKFDEGIGTTAYNSAGSNNGILSGSTKPTWTDGKSNTGIAFSGVGDYVSLPYKPNFRNALTVSVWMKRTTNYNQLTDVMFLSPPNAWYFYDSYNSGSVRGDVYIDGVRKGAINVPVPFDGNWYHITYTYDSATHFAKMYKNGVLYQSVEITGLSNYLIDPATGNLYNFGSNSLGRGMILDEPKIYNYARTADQIKQDYNSRGNLSGSSANLGVQSSTAPDLNSSLIAYYKLDEGSGNKFYDSITSYVAGVSSSTAPTWQNNSQCYKGKCLLFNGINNEISLGNSSNLDFSTENFTVSAWINQTSSANNKKIIFKGNPFCDTCTGGYTLFTHAGVPRFAVNLTTASGDSYSTYNNSLTINDGKWHFVAGQRSGDIIKLFVDGKFISNTSLSTGATIVDSGSYFYISGSSYSYEGSIDELKIYNTALTDEQIKQDYNQGSAISFGSTNQTIGGTTTSLDYCIPGDTSYCAPPVAEWKMDEGIGTSIIDTSGNSNTGTFGAGSSAPTWAQGKIGKGLIFDGSNDYVNIGTLNSLNTFTLSAWIKANSNSTSDYRTIIDKTNNSMNDRNFWLALETSTSQLSLRFSVDGSSTTFLGNTPLNDNKWHYVNATYDGSYVKLFIDGKLDNTPTAKTGIPNTGNTSSYIGYQPVGGGRYFSGSIDHVKIYNYARTPAQVAYDYNRGGPVGWWKMDECQGSTIYDWSGNGNNGTLTIGSSGSQNSIGTCQIGTSAAWTNGATGKVNSSLNFDGTDDYVSVGDTATFSMDSNLTVSAWIKTNSTNTYQRIITKPLLSSSDYGYSLAIRNTGKFWGVIHTSNGYFGTSDSTASVTTNWTHLAMTYNGSNLLFYINGVLDKNTSVTGGNITYDTDVLKIGKNGGELFNGQIDDVRIYNYALTPEQIKQIYNGGAISFN